MTAGLLYPRLDDATAMRIREDLLGLSPAEAQNAAALSHGRQYFAAVGGRRVTEAQLADVQRSVLHAVQPMLDAADRGQLTQATRPAIDRAAGRALYDAMDIVRSDAAHDGVWSFLSLVVLPGVLLARFPDAPIQRALGRPRNVLRRAWWRHVLLKDLADPHSNGPLGDVPPLGEDEMVQLLERSTIASDGRLVQLLAQRILNHRSANRSDFARRLTRRVLAELAHVEQAVLSDEDLAHFVDAIERPRPSPAPPDRPQTFTRSTNPAEPASGPVPVTTRYKGHTVEGSLDVASGTLYIESDWWPGNRKHTSPSAAANHVVETLNPARRSPATNGWRFWRLRATGASINVLREE